MINKLPHSLEAEVMLLANIFVDPTIVPSAASDIKEAYFHDPRNKVVFRAIMDLYEKGLDVDPFVVEQYLRDQGLLEKSGGIEYLNEFNFVLISSVHYKTHLKIASDLYKRREAIIAADKIMAEAINGGKDPDDIIQQAQEHLYGITTLGSEGYKVIDRYLMDALESIDAASKDARGIRGIPTGFWDLDKILGGLLPGKLYILAARPSTGKTAMALNIIDNVIKHSEGNVLLNSLEQDGTTLALRLLSANSGVELERLIHGIGMKGDRIKRVIDAADKLYGKKFYIDDFSLKKATQIRNSVKAFAAQHGPVRLLVVDFMQLLQDEETAKSHEYSLANSYYVFKSLAKELKASCIVLSQVKRAVDDRDNPEPKLSDLAESSGADNAADGVIFLWKPKQNKGDLQEIPENLVMASIPKHRDGPKGQAELLFSGKYTRFDNYLRDTGYLAELAKTDPLQGEREP